jgi:hypothetical protein
MVCRQLVCLRKRIEALARSPEKRSDPETGERDQYQLAAVIYADGSSAGRWGVKLAEHFRENSS